MLTAIEAEQLKQRVYAQIAEWEEAVARLNQKRALIREAVQIRVKLGATFDEDDVAERLEQILLPEEIQFAEEHVPASIRADGEAQRLSSGLRKFLASSSASNIPSAQMVSAKTLAEYAQAVIRSFGQKDTSNENP